MKNKLQVTLRSMKSINARLHWTTTVTEKLMLGGIGVLELFVAAANEVWGMWLLCKILN